MGGGPVTAATYTRLASPDPLPAHVKARLGIEVVVTYVRVRLLMRRRPIGGVANALRPAVEPLVDPQICLRVGWRLADPVHRILDPGPWDARCLMRSLVLLNMLAKRGISSTLIIGVRSGAEGAEFAAHAWIEHENRPLLPTLGFEPLTTL